MLINVLVDYHHFLLFWFSLFYTLKFLIHYFQFVNFTHFFQPSYSPLGALKNSSIQCKPVGLPTKCSIELLVITVFQNAKIVYVLLCLNTIKGNVITI